MNVDLNRLAKGLKMIIDRLTPKPVDNVIFELDTDKTFCKFKGNALDINKVLCAFVEFDSFSKKLKQSMDVYWDIPEALCFCHDVLSGKIPMLASKEKQRCSTTGEKYPKEVYSTPLGGVSEKKCQERNLRNDGKAISRLFTVSPGSKADYVITAIQRAGHTDEKKKKLIVPEGAPEVLIRVAFSERQLKALALTIQSHINAFYSARYANNGFARTNS